MVVGIYRVRIIIPGREPAREVTARNEIILFRPSRCSGLGRNALERNIYSIFLPVTKYIFIIFPYRHIRGR